MKKMTEITGMTRVTATDKMMMIIEKTRITGMTRKI